MGASVTADGGCTNNKMAADGLLRRPPRSTRGCAATPAWPADERVVLRKERTPRVPCQFFPNVWPFEILAEPRCKANRSSYHPAPVPVFLSSSFHRISDNPADFPHLLKTTRISGELPMCLEMGHTECQRHTRCIEFSSSLLSDFRIFPQKNVFMRDVFRRM